MFVFLVGVEVVEDDVKLSARKSRADALEKRPRYATQLVPGIRAE